MRKITIFDIAVLDTNFFIALLSAGIGGLIPKLQHYMDIMGTIAVTSEHVPKTDVPSKFRSLRSTIPQSVDLQRVNRTDPLWAEIAKSAKREKMIAYEKDPADIDICFVALKKFKQGKKVAVVSDDVGVARVINENPEFSGIEHLSNGAFLSILSTTMPPDKKARLDKGTKIVFLQSWKYRNRTRSYIDINLLVDDLTDTARFVRLAAEKEVQKAGEKLGIDIKRSKDIIKEDTKLEIDANRLMKIFEDFRIYRDQNNIFAIERKLSELPQLTSSILAESSNPEEKLIFSQMIYAELFELHSFALNYRIKRNSLIEALLHAEALMSICNFVQTSPEILENIIALKGLICLLLGEFDTGKELLTLIPVDDNISPTQLLGLTVSFISYDQSENAKDLIEKNIAKFEGLASALYKYANDCYLRGQRKLGIKILEFVFRNYYLPIKEYRAHLNQFPLRLFVLSRIAPSILDEKTSKGLLDVLGNIAKDKTRYKIPQTLKMRKNQDRILIDEKTPNPLEGLFYLLSAEKNIQNQELELLVWHKELSSLWKIILALEMEPAISEAISFRIKQGEITAVKPSKHERGILEIKNPILQVNLKIPWQD